MERLIGWLFDWDRSIPLHNIWSDADTRFGTSLKWRRRLRGWFVCPVRGHDWDGVRCAITERDECVRCSAERDPDR